jgi:hypothetical protein
MARVEPTFSYSRIVELADINNLGLTASEPITKLLPLCGPNVTEIGILTKITQFQHIPSICVVVNAMPTKVPDRVNVVPKDDLFYCCFPYSLNYSVLPNGNFSNGRTYSLVEVNDKIAIGFTLKVEPVVKRVVKPVSPESPTPKVKPPVAKELHPVLESALDRFSRNNASYLSFPVNVTTRAGVTQKNITFPTPYAKSVRECPRGDKCCNISCSDHSNSAFRKVLRRIIDEDWNEKDFHSQLKGSAEVLLGAYDQYFISDNVDWEDVMKKALLAAVVSGPAFSL